MGLGTPMQNSTRSILKTLLQNDESLSLADRNALERLVSGQVETKPAGGREVRGRIYITQEEAAVLLGVSRQTVWRHTKPDGLQQYEVLPGIWRYDYDEIAARGRNGRPGTDSTDTEDKEAA